MAVRVPSLVTDSLAGQDRNHIDFSMCKVKLLLNVLIYDAFQTVWGTRGVPHRLACRTALLQVMLLFFPFQNINTKVLTTSLLVLTVGILMSICRRARTHYDFSSVKGRGYVLEPYLPTEHPSESKAPTLSLQDCGEATLDFWWLLLCLHITSYY